MPHAVPSTAPTGTFSATASSATPTRGTTKGQYRMVPSCLRDVPKESTDRLGRTAGATRGAWAARRSGVEPATPRRLAGSARLDRGDGAVCLWHGHRRRGADLVPREASGELARPRPTVGVEVREDGEVGGRACAEGRNGDRTAEAVSSLVEDFHRHVDRIVP